jgi:nucleotide-binding universal stress UspA family protein
MFKHILIPTDGSKTADKAVQAGIEFARDSNAKVTALVAMPTYPTPSRNQLISGKYEPIEKYEQRTLAQGAKVLERVEKIGKAAGVKVNADVVLSDTPYDAIIKSAKKNGCDLIFMASHGRTGLQELLHGSQTHEVLTKSTIPTLVYR